MKSILTIILLFLSIQIYYSQVREVNILFNELDQAQNPSEKLVILKNLLELDYGQTNKEKIKYAEEGINISRTVKDTSKLIEFNLYYTHLLVKNYILHDIPSILNYIDQLLKTNDKDIFHFKRNKIEAQYNYVLSKYRKSINLFYKNCQYNIDTTSTDFIDCLLLTSDAYRELRIQDSSKLFIERAKLITKNNSLTSAEIKVLHSLGKQNLNQSDYTLAITIFKEALQKSRALNDTLQIANSLQYLGSAYNYQTNLDLALESLLKSLKLYERLNYISGMAQVYNLIGSVYTNRDNNSESFKYYKMAFEYDLKSGNQLAISQSYNNLGIYYLGIEDYETALDYFHKSLTLSKILKNRSQQGTENYNIAYCLTQLNKIAQAKPYAYEAYKIDKETESKYGLCYSMKLYGRILSIDGNIIEAERLLFDGLEISKSINARRRIQNFYVEIAEHYERHNYYKSAFNYYKNFADLRDSIYTQTSLEKTAELQTKYETEKKEKEIQILENENKQHELKIDQQTKLQYILLLILVIIIITASSIYFGYRFRVKQAKLLESKNREINFQKEKLEASEEKFRTIYINSPIGIYRIDANGHIITVNPAFLRIFNIEKEDEIIGKNLHFFADNNELGNSLHKSLLKNGSLSETEYVYKDRNGKRIYVMESAKLMKNSDNEIKYIDGIITDITEKKNAENKIKLFVDELQQKQEELINNEKELLELNEKLTTSESTLKDLNFQKDKYFSIIAHDLRSPFTALLGLTDYLLSNIHTMSPTDVHDSISSVNKSAHRVYNLLENLLEWSRIQTGKSSVLTTFNLNEIVEENIELFSHNISSKNIDVYSKQDETKMINADRNMISGLVRNLLSNAIKFTPRNGSIKLITYSVNSDSVFEISDNGIGMSKEKVATLFELSRNTNTPGTENETGSGLGLILCKEYAERNNGTIKVESEPTKGTTFIVSLPTNHNYNPNGNIVNE